LAEATFLDTSSQPQLQVQSPDEKTKPQPQFQSPNYKSKARLENKATTRSLIKKVAEGHLPRYEFSAPVASPKPRRADNAPTTKKKVVGGHLSPYELSASATTNVYVLPDPLAVKGAPSPRTAKKYMKASITFAGLLFSCAIAFLCR